MTKPRMVGNSADQRSEGPAALRIPSDPSAAEAWLDARLRDGLEGGEPVGITPETWSRLEEEAVGRVLERRQAS